ncbi:endonuclease NucS domain-containing protein [Pedobacter sp. PWIIR3]
MKNYYRIMLGKGSLYANECFKESFIGADFGFEIDLTGHLPENWREFNKKFIPYFLTQHPEKTKVAAGLACGALHTVAKGIHVGDIILSPNGAGTYFIGEVIGDYFYQPGKLLPHRRPVKWLAETIDRSEMSTELKNSAGSIGTVSLISKYASEIESLLIAPDVPSIVATDSSIEDPTVFALEKHLEDFLVHNWKYTELGKSYDIFEDEGEIVGRQFPSDTGPIDILAVSKDKKELLIVELKRGRASDQVVGQIQRYMGYVLQELAEPGQLVKGVIIALDDDLKIRRALAVTSKISFYRYKVSFSLFKN